MEKHNTGKGVKYTKSRKPVELVCISPELAKNDALKLEYRIKRTVAGKKIAELEKTGLKIAIERDLKALAKEIRALGKKVERIARAIENPRPHSGREHTKIHRSKNHKRF